MNIKEIAEYHRREEEYNLERAKEWLSDEPTLYPLDKALHAKPFLKKAEGHGEMAKYLEGMEA